MGAQRLQSKGGGQGLQAGSVQSQLLDTQVCGKPFELGAFGEAKLDERIAEALQRFQPRTVFQRQPFCGGKVPREGAHLPETCKEHV